jgi:hypothetical protein
MALAIGESVRDWAKKQSVPVSARSAYRWAEKPAVRAKAAKFRAELIDRAIGYMSRAAATAAGTLWTVCSDPAEPSAIRISAARSILTSLIAVESHATLAARVAELEARLGADDEAEPKRK